jgi:hypothetical protein
MDAHVQELLDELGAEWLTHGDSWVAHDGSKSACAGIITGERGTTTGAFISLPREEYANARVAYFVALHEIGHLYQHRGARGWIKKPWPTRRLDQEQTAWHTAMRLSMFKPTKAVWKHIHESLATYAEVALSDHRYSRSPQFTRLLLDSLEWSL